MCRMIAPGMKQMQILSNFIGGEHTIKDDLYWPHSLQTVVRRPVLSIMQPALDVGPTLLYRRSATGSGQSAPV
jgi:hypothetical protein